MRYRTRHAIGYTYNKPVDLGPHVLRLRPRCNGTQRLHRFTATVDPAPLGTADQLDLDGNATLKLWFDDRPAESLSVVAEAEVETLLENPFAYLLEPWAVQIPFDYPSSLRAQLQPYFRETGAIGDCADPVVWELAQTLLHKSHGNVQTFLGRLNKTIYGRCQYRTRETGDPLPAGIVWKQASGSCRDLTVLFMETCRAVGLAARFVSGYEIGDPENPEKALHAWAEVYLPGAGWRGYDPTQGLVVADRHIPLVAGPRPQDTAPLPGAYRGRGVQADLSYELTIDLV